MPCRYAPSGKSGATQLIVAQKSYATNERREVILRSLAAEI